ncbi:hypothetical protein NPIL_399201 [Nephila pilipes]|uniref:Uncharacterized protein n=1 Tax=Nephila pilipes TaxID=299642 RepID=A0A8X6TYH6_NEPPI|nr:hypothetical protein NPIL_399201 [Nephila pilipes]
MHYRVKPNRWGFSMGEKSLPPHPIAMGGGGSEVKKSRRSSDKWGFDCVTIGRLTGGKRDQSALKVLKSQIESEREYFDRG